MSDPHSTVGTTLISAKDQTTEHRALESIGPNTERVALSRPVQCWSPLVSRPICTKYGDDFFSPVLRPPTHYAQGTG